MRIPPSLKRLIPLFVFIFSFAIASAQNGTIKGTVRDERAPLAGASVTVADKGIGTTTNESGVYELQVAPGRYTIAISYVGYQLYSKRVDVKPNEISVQDVAMQSSSQGEEIVITGSRSQGRSKLSTPAPVDVIPISQVVNDIGQVDLNQIINFIAPSFQSSRQTIADGTDHVDPAQLRGLGT